MVKMANVKTKAYLEREARVAWFEDIRFGLFVHWGAYAIPARGEWVRSSEELSVEDYQKYVDEFNPKNCDMREWARLAKAAGMKYAVMTAKHHDGFCLFDTKTTGYNTFAGAAKRDFVREFVDAMRAEGLRVGLYYSLLDWYHPDYPAYGDRQHPMRNNPAFKDKLHNFDTYLGYMHQQVRELCTNYGQLDIMWFDFSYHQYKGEKWRATELANMVRELQPGILIDDRLGGDMNPADPTVFSGDFHGPEQGIPRDRLVNEQGYPIPWEACITLNNSWGYTALDKAYKDPRFVIRTMANCVSKGGNLIVNVGPNAYGEIDAQSQDILLKVGQWLSRNGESIYGAGAADFERPEWGRFTQKGNKLYAHVMEQVVGHISLKGLKGKIKKARLLQDGSEVVLTDFWNREVDDFDAPDDIFMNYGLPVHATFAMPDAVDTVVELTLEE